MMKIYILTLQPNGEGQREVAIEVSGKFNPSVMREIQARAIEAWNEVFLDGEVEEIDDEMPADPFVSGEEA